MVVTTTDDVNLASAADDDSSIRSVDPVSDDDDDHVEFAHGTTREAGIKILDRGIDYDAGLQAMFGSKKPGSFFTIKIDPSRPYEALDTAAAWGARHGGAVSVVLLRLPQSIVDGLEASGSLTHNIHPVESIFHPRSFETVNRQGEWNILHIGE